MRPRKVVLVLHGQEQELGVLATVLDARGYNVLAFDSAAPALRVVERRRVDAILAELSVPCGTGDADEFARQVKLYQPETPVLLFSRRVASLAVARARHADAFLPKNGCSPLEILERLRILISRKRGPKKASGQCSVVSVQEVSA